MVFRWGNDGLVALPGGWRSWPKIVNMDPKQSVGMGPSSEMPTHLGPAVVTKEANPPTLPGHCQRLGRPLVWGLAALAAASIGP